MGWELSYRSAESTSLTALLTSIPLRMMHGGQLASGGKILSLANQLATNALGNFCLNYSEMSQLLCNCPLGSEFGALLSA